MIILLIITIYIITIFIARFARKFWYDEPDGIDYIMWFIPTLNVVYSLSLLIVIIANFILKVFSQKPKMNRIFKWFFNYEKLRRKK